MFWISLEKYFLRGAGFKTSESPAPIPIHTYTLWTCTNRVLQRYHTICGRSSRNAKLDLKDANNNQFNWNRILMRVFERKSELNSTINWPSLDFKFKTIAPPRQRTPTLIWKSFCTCLVFIKENQSMEPVFPFIKNGTGSNYWRWKDLFFEKLVRTACAHNAFLGPHFSVSH